MTNILQAMWGRTMRAFLSHSSRDKGFVEAVADNLKPGTFELDSLTFDSGQVNSQAIISALKRSDLFVLFLSNASANSSYVDFETLLGTELLAQGQIGRFLAICLDESSFAIASSTTRYFNVVRRSLSPESAARLIQGALVAAALDTGSIRHPFVGREEELLELEKQISDPEREVTKAIYVSGNYGSGRRTVARKVYQNQFPHVGSVFPEISFVEFAGLDELHRAVLSAIRPSITAAQLRTHLTAFAVSDEAEKLRQIAELLDGLLASREAAFVVDNGGLLAEDGQFRPEVSQLLDRLSGRPHPPVAFISPRMMPSKYRRQSDVAYAGIRSLKPDESARLASRLMKDASLSFTPDQLEDVVALADGHPFNFYRLMDEAKERGAAAFLADPGDFINWKHRQSSEYLARVSLSRDDGAILGLLRLLPSLDFSAVVEALPIEAEKISSALLRLGSLHVVENVGDNFLVSPALRVAVEKDSRIGLAADQQTRALSVLAKSLQVRIDDGSAAVALIDSAIISAIEANADNTSFAAAFLLPSHYVWLAKRNYDQRRFEECIRLGKLALRGASRLSSAAFIAACRFMCLAAARLGDGETFDEGIGRLRGRANDPLAKSNVAFLRGFNARMHGNLPQAETHFREAYSLSNGNISAAREIAAISLVRRNLGAAEEFARRALAYAPTNPYLVDILISVLIRKLGRSAAGNPEVRELFDRLERVGDEDGRSFYTTRRAELEHLWGDNALARKLIDEAIHKTPSIFDAHRIRAEILLKEGNSSKAGEDISWMRERINSRDSSERRSNYRLFLEVEARYLTEIGQFSAAKALFDDRTVFTDEEREAGKKEVEIVQSYIGKGGKGR